MGNRDEMRSGEPKRVTRTISPGATPATKTSKADRAQKRERDKGGEGGRTNWQRTLMNKKPRRQAKEGATPSRKVNENARASSNAHRQGRERSRRGSDTRGAAKASLDKTAPLHVLYNY